MLSHWALGAMQETVSAYVALVYQPNLSTFVGHVTYLRHVRQPPTLLIHKNSHILNNKMPKLEPLTSIFPKRPTFRLNH